MSKSYGQYCALAKALDRLGERWTFLVVRELLLGPRRYTDLRRALPGIATNLLADRLRSLEDDGVLDRRELEPPLSATVYELTDLGRELREPILALMRWAGRWMLEGRGEDHVEPGWLVLALESLRLGDRGLDGSATIDLDVDGDHLHIVAEGDDVAVRAGRAPAGADVSIAADAPTTLGLFAGAVPRTKVRVRGDRHALGRVLDLFGLPSYSGTMR